MNLFKPLKAPCAKCPYKLGLVKTLVNPCPQCKANGYMTYKQLTGNKFDKNDSSKEEK